MDQALDIEELLRQLGGKNPHPVTRREAASVPPDQRGELLDRRTAGEELAPGGSLQVPPTMSDVTMTVPELMSQFEAQKRKDMQRNQGLQDITQGLSSIGSSIANAAAQRAGWAPTHKPMDNAGAIRNMADIEDRASPAVLEGYRSRGLEVPSGVSLSELDALNKAYAATRLSGITGTLDQPLDESALNEYRDVYDYDFPSGTTQRQVQTIVQRLNLTAKQGNTAKNQAQRFENSQALGEQSFARSQAARQQYTPTLVDTEVKRFGDKLDSDPSFKRAQVAIYNLGILQSALAEAADNQVAVSAAALEIAKNLFGDTGVLSNQDIDRWLGARGLPYVQQMAALWTSGNYPAVTVDKMRRIVDTVAPEIFKNFARSLDAELEEFPAYFGSNFDENQTAEAMRRARQVAEAKFKWAIGAAKAAGYGPIPGGPAPAGGGGGGVRFQEGANSWTIPEAEVQRFLEAHPNAVRK